MTPNECGVAGPPSPFRNCPGPCKLGQIESNPPKSRFYPEKIGNKSYVGGGMPAASYARGERVIIKYARNNHSPGGFSRFTLVRPDETMNRAAHDRNAFWYSCWGAKFREAIQVEKDLDEFGFNINGVDGRRRTNGVPEGYFTADIVIPNCVPDGKYILGMVWYGGTGGNITTNDPKTPGQLSFYGDYWSCSFIEINGGTMADSCEVVFKADSKFSKDKCFASVDRPGAPECNATVKNPQSFSEVCQCKVEPCLKNGQPVRGSYMVPASFNGTKPAPLTPRNWGAEMPTILNLKSPEAPVLLNEPSPSPSSEPKMSYEELKRKYEELKAKYQQGTFIKPSRGCCRHQFEYCKRVCEA